MTDFHLLNSADDEQTGDGASTTVTVMQTRADMVISFFSQAHAHIDTSAIGTDAITAATLHWYTDGTIKSPKAATWDQFIQVGGSTIYSNTATGEPAGWASHGLTAGELALINKSGDTEIVFRVSNPLAGQARLWEIRAWDFAPTGTFSTYLAVTHAAAGGPTKMTILGV